MEEKNPLEIHTAAQSKKSLHSNKSGRPNLDKAIIFTAQPKSIISQLLNKVTEDNCNGRKEKKVSSKTTTEPNSLNVNNQMKLGSEIQPTPKDTSEDICRSFTLHLVKSEDNHECKDSNETYSLLDNSQDSQNNLTSDSKNENELQLAAITCYVCSHRSSSHRAHRKHMSVHRNQPYKCNFPDCSYESKLSSNLIKHKRIHTAEKPYLCDQCTFRSNFGNSLKVHKRTHTSERPYGCQYCSYRCNSSSNLKKHCLHRHPKSINQQQFEKEAAITHDGQPILC